MAFYCLFYPYTLPHCNILRLFIGGYNRKITYFSGTTFVVRDPLLNSWMYKKIANTIGNIFLYISLLFQDARALFTMKREEVMIFITILLDWYFL